MMGGKRTPPWLVLGAGAMLCAILWLLFAGLVDPAIWVVGVILAALGALLLLVRILRSPG